MARLHMFEGSCSLILQRSLLKKKNLRLRVERLHMSSRGEGTNKLMERRLRKEKFLRHKW